MLSRRLLMSGGPFTPLVGTGVLTIGAISTITDDTKYNAWPVICRIDTGELLLAYTKGDSHHGDNTGKAVGKLSSDEGATWGSEFTIYDDASLWATVMGISTTQTGRIIATLWRDNYSVSATGVAGFVTSDDDGATWSAWTSFGVFAQEDYSAGPAIRLVDDDLLVTVEGTDSGSVANRSSHTLRSNNDGTTWGGEVVIRDYATDTRPYYETKLVRLTGDTVLAVHRTSGGTGTHYLSTSTDNGYTWGTPTAIFDGYGAPSTIRAYTGTLISVTRRNSDAAAIAFTSIDDGATWSSAYVLDATMFEMEYACPVQLNDGRVLIVYGSQPTSSTTNSDIKQVYVTEGLA